MTLRNYTSSHDVGSVRKGNYIDEIFRDGQKKEKASARRKSKKKTKTKQAKHLMMTRDYRSELVNTIKKKQKTKQTFHKYYGK